MLVPYRSLNVSHNGTAHCKKGAEQKQQRLVTEEEREVTSRSLSAYGLPLNVVTSFKYLGRVLLMADDDWMTVIRNILKARTVWWIMSKILSREGVRPRVSVFFFKSIIQLVLLFDAESWVVTPHMVWYLRGFQDHMARRLTGRLSWQSINVRF